MMHPLPCIGANFKSLETLLAPALDGKGASLNQCGLWPEHPAPSPDIALQAVKHLALLHSPQST